MIFFGSIEIYEYECVHVRTGVCPPSICPVYSLLDLEWGGSKKKEREERENMMEKPRPEAKPKVS